MLFRHWSQCDEEGSFFKDLTVSPNAPEWPLQRRLTTMQSQVISESSNASRAAKFGTEFVDTGKVPNIDTRLGEGKIQDGNTQSKPSGNQGLQLDFDLITKVESKPLPLVDAAEAAIITTGRGLSLAGSYASASELAEDLWLNI